MQCRRRPVLLALCAWLVPLFGANARAAELIQLTLSGEIETVGGAQIEVELAARGEDRPVELRLALHLAQHTSGADLAELLASRLGERGFSTLLTGNGRSGGGPVQLFVERVTRVRLRLGHGIEVSVAVCEGTPTSVRLDPPEVRTAPLTLTLSASGFHPHSMRRSQASVELAELEATVSSAKLAGLLFQGAIEEDLISERLRTDAWRPIRMSDGSVLTGFTLAMEGAGDWTLELDLAG